MRRVLLIIVWTGGTFSHCGVDAFDPIRTTEGWKIAGGALTIEAQCEPSPLGPLKQLGAPESFPHGTTRPLL